jgi:DNA ligase-1
MNETQMTLGRNWDGRDVSGWLASEKYDGCRAYWDGSKLWTREGNIICAPKWFTQSLPACMELDGEIWAGRGRFNEAMRATRDGVFTPLIRLMVFDAPQVAGAWAARMDVAKSSLNGSAVAAPVPYAPLASVPDMWTRFDEVKAGGGEGLMLRDYRCNGYEYGRTNKLLKVKMIEGVK